MTKRFTNWQVTQRIHPIICSWSILFCWNFIKQINLFHHNEILKTPTKYVTKSNIPCQNLTSVFERTPPTPPRCQCCYFAWHTFDLFFLVKRLAFLTAATLKLWGTGLKQKTEVRFWRGLADLLLLCCCSPSNNLLIENELTNYSWWLSTS